MGKLCSKILPFLVSASNTAAEAGGTAELETDEGRHDSCLADGLVVGISSKGNLVTCMKEERNIKTFLIDKYKKGWMDGWMDKCRLPPHSHQCSPVSLEAQQRCCTSDIHPPPLELGPAADRAATGRAETVAETGRRAARLPETEMQEEEPLRHESHRLSLHNYPHGRSSLSRY